MPLPQHICKDLTNGKSSASAIAMRLRVPETKVVEELTELELTGHVSSAPLLLDHNDKEKPLIITVWKLEKPLH